MIGNTSYYNTGCKIYESGEKYAKEMCISRYKGRDAQSFLPSVVMEHNTLNNEGQVRVVDYDG